MAGHGDDELHGGRLGLLQLLGCQTEYVGVHELRRGPWWLDAAIGDEFLAEQQLIEAKLLERVAATKVLARMAVDGHGAKPLGSKRPDQRMPILQFIQRELIE